MEIILVIIILMKGVFLVLFLLSCGLSFSQVREKFYIAEEMFLSGEYVKARGIYLSLDVSKLSAYERNIVSYRMAFFTNISTAIILLSNSNLKEAREPIGFINAYLGRGYGSIPDLINLGDEVEVYSYLDKVSNTGVFDVDFALMLYFSLSNLKDRVQAVAKSDFENLKLRFGEMIIKRNLGDEDGFNVSREYILNSYPDSFWAKVLLRDRDIKSSYRETDERVTLSPGFYVVISDKVDVVKEFLTLKNYRVFEVEKSIYVGPYYTQLEAQKEAEKFSRDYKVSVKVVQIRMQ